jgi:hypothetical protein
MHLRPLTKSRWMQGVVIATLVLFAVAGFCMFEGDHDDDHTGPVHVCLAMLATGVAPIPVIELLVIGGATILAGFGLPTVALRVPVPPPKLATSL